MTIDAEEAFAIANAASQQEGWGGLSTQKYEAIKFEFEGRTAWQVSRINVIIRGFQVWFVIDAETGAVLQKNRLGGR